MKMKIIPKLLVSNHYQPTLILILVNMKLKWQVSLKKFHSSLHDDQKILHHIVITFFQKCSLQIRNINDTGQRRNLISIIDHQDTNFLNNRTTGDN